MLANSSLNQIEPSGLAVVAYGLAPFVGTYHSRMVAFNSPTSAVLEATSVEIAASVKRAVVKNLANKRKIPSIHWLSGRRV